MTPALANVRPHSQPRRAHGFTLTEVLAVLAMISLLVVASSPTFVKLMRDRRVNRAAMQLVDYLRTARAMAIGRGQPIVVSWDSKAGPGTTATGLLQLVEPVVIAPAAAGGVGLVGHASTCGLTQWGTTATQVVAGFDLSHYGAYEYASVTFFDDTNATPNYSEICFSPTGRMYLRNGSGGKATGSFHAVLGVPAFTVLNVSTGLPRRVFLPPNGVARIQL